MFSHINRCRICGNEKLLQLVHLGDQYLTGIFPKTREEKLTSGPLELVKCSEEDGKSCGLVQLRHSYPLEEMYGDNYGYRSGLNSSMINHLHNKVRYMQSMASLKQGDVILDIGSNDSTLLQGYPKDTYTLVGMDPTGKKFEGYYPDYIRLIPDFFSANVFQEHFGDRKAKVVTSIAMFYDLESPIDFMRQVHEVLDDEGIWVFEQSYMPTMLEINSYDTICHEHLEYYGLKEIKWMTDRVGFKIIDVEFNSVNGGSFSIAVAKTGSSHREATSLVEKILQKEEMAGLSTLKPYESFRKAIYQHREDLIRFLHQVRSEGKKILGYGASTKGNVILQFCGLTDKDLPFIAEVNRDKFGCYTPGTHVPIISEEEARAMKPNYFLVLPWHFRDSIVKREHQYLRSGGKLVFPLPRIEIVGA